MQETGPDTALEARINSFELAFRMQTAAPQLQDVADESDDASLFMRITEAYDVLRDPRKRKSYDMRRR